MTTFATQTKTEPQTEVFRPLPAVEARGLVKSFDGAPAVDGLSLDVCEGEILALVGPSGCGKTTLLRMIAGFERPERGEIALQGRAVEGRAFVPPERRGVGMVFQDYALFPHLTVGQNVAFGLQDAPKKERLERAEAALELVGLPGYGGRYPHELSGGERQRVALARALAPRPVLVLLDEPFSNLDADRRSQMREEVRSILKRSRATAVFVTHDQEEALFMGDRLAVMRRGRLEQVASPEEIFHHPATRFVAEFMGDTDFLPAVVTRGGLETEIGRIPQRVDLPVGTPVELAVRADDIAFEPDEYGESRIGARVFKGAVNVYRLELPSGLRLHSLQAHTHLLPAGTPVRVYADPGHDLACFHEGVAV